MRLLTLVGCLATVAVMTATATGNEVHSQVAGNADTVASHSAGKNAPSGADSAHHSPEPSDGAAHTYVEPAPPLNPNEEVLHIDVVRGGKVVHVNVIGDRAVRLRAARYEQLHHVPSPEEEEQARMLGAVLWFVVGAQYLLYVWKRRSMATYQKATLVLLAVVPALGALRFWAWRFLSVWALYLFGAYRAVAMTKVRPLPRTAPATVYGWFLGAHKLSQALVMGGYLLGLADFNGFNLGWLLVRFGPQSWHCQEPYPPPTEGPHAGKHMVLHPDPWPVVLVRMACTLAVLNGLYFGILTRDLAEVCTLELSAALGLSKRDNDDDDEAQSEWQRKNLCSLCGGDLVPPSNSHATPLLSHASHNCGTEDHAAAEAERVKQLNRLASLTHPALGGVPNKKQNSTSSSGGSGAGRGKGAVPQKPEPLFTLSCGHTFHESCIRGWAIVGKQNTCPYCAAPVDLGSLLGSSPWQKQSLLWINTLDAIRYLIVWHPLILAAAHFSVRHILGYHPLIVDEAHPHHPDFQGHPWQQLGNATITTGHVAAAEKAPAVPVPLGAH